MMVAMMDFGASSSSAVQKDSREIHDAKKHERHVCGRARIGERPVS